MYKYCQSEIEGSIKCKNQCKHCKEYYKSLEIDDWEDISRYDFKITIIAAIILFIVVFGLMFISS